MAPRQRTNGRSLNRRLFVRPTERGAALELSEEDTRHALTVLRLAAGDQLIGIDGQGSAWPLRVLTRDKRSLVLERTGEAQREPPPGAHGAPLPWIELAVALPRGARAEELVDHVTQLGVAALSPLVAEHSAPEARALSEARHARLVRIAREACKQSGRLWMPVLNPLRTPIELVRETRAAHVLLLAPEAQLGLSQWLATLDRQSAARWTPDAPLLVAIGPEGGFSPADLSAFDAAGAVRVRVGPHILRIETAAEAALAILSEALFTAPRS